jgi:hypothetical protein
MGSEEVVNEIVPDQLPTHSAPPRATFLPWHRVRKEYIRRYQWNYLTGRMIKRQWKRELRQPDHEWSLEDSETVEPSFEPVTATDLKQPLKCLVIPGDDLLDLRALHRDVQSLNCWIQYLGFNESEGSSMTGTQVHISNNAVLALPRMRRESMVLHDRFEALASPDSLATNRLKDFGPYHVVNLDLCGSICPNTDKDSGEFYQALGELLKYQCTRQNTEWLLFITTMVEPKRVHVEGFDTLCKPTRKNYDEHKDFSGLVECLIPAEAFTDTDRAVNVSRLNEEQLIQLFGLAFGKWLLAFCQQAQPRWTVAMRPSFVYSMNETEGAVMLSLAFALKPNLSPPVDTTGMTAPQPAQKPFPTEGECAVKMAESIANLRSIEDILAKDPALKAQLAEAQARLLESAGYDPIEYMKWVSDGEGTSGN